MARGVSRHIRLSRERAAKAWAAAALAVEAICGEPPPTARGVLAGGRRHDRQAVLRRKYAIYTAVCGLGVMATHIAPFAGVAPTWVLEEVLPELEAARDGDQVDYLLDALTAKALELMGLGGAVAA